MIFVGIDNGVTGNIGIISGDQVIYVSTPVKRCLNYTKSVQWLHRIDSVKLGKLLSPWTKDDLISCLIERPLVNPGRWKATMSAIRALEATQTVLDGLRIPYNFIDSRVWQKKLLPTGVSKEDLKEASLQVGKRLFPRINWTGKKDADGLLIAEYWRQVTYV